MLLTNNTKFTIYLLLLMKVSIFFILHVNTIFSILRNCYHLMFIKWIISGEKVTSPLGSINFLNDMDNLLKSRFTVRNVEECIRPEGSFLKYNYYIDTCEILIFLSDTKTFISLHDVTLPMWSQLKILSSVQQWKTSSHFWRKQIYKLCNNKYSYSCIQNIINKKFVTE
jgi:hypothetical protein